MNIEQAKKQVKYAVISYLSKDEFGDYQIPIQRQRPVFLMGPPGIGKTDIMRQVADEMDIALVSYSMSHHTRQSALGLPFISNKVYDGKEYRTTEYTMSEIIASVYDVMEETGKKEGILFLDEINCISETLAPSMLQFLQYKVFGRHQVPEGWVIVTAGNPPEYNRSVRDFDLATLDRLKRIDVEPDFDAWWHYAQNQEIHTAVLTYLEIKKDDFYSVQTTVDGTDFVTARSWVDLSDMMKLYEDNQLPVDQELIYQYIQDERIARDFSAYYDLFYRFRETYRIDQILSGNADPGVIQMGKKAEFDERITVIRLLIDGLTGEFSKINQLGEGMNRLMLQIRDQKEAIASADRSQAVELMDAMTESVREDLQRKKSANAISSQEIHVIRQQLALLGELASQLSKAGSSHPSSPMEIMKAFLGEKQRLRKERAAEIGSRLENVFAFIHEAYGENEMLIFVTALTDNRDCAQFIATYGSDSYYEFNQKLMLDRREKDLVERIRQMEE